MQVRVLISDVEHTLIVCKSQMARLYELLLEDQTVRNLVFTKMKFVHILRAKTKLSLTQKKKKYQIYFLYK